MPNHRRQDRELDALYASLPKLQCKGYCHDSCGPIGMSVRERARIIERARKPVTCDAHATCSMLTPDRRCAVYDIRPMVCRLWGLVKSMRCPYGCVPEGGFMSEADGVTALLESERIGGSELGTAAFQRMMENLKRFGAEEIARLAWVGAGHGASIAGRSAALPPEARPIMELRNRMEDQ
jgi:hypothetical protein